MTDDPIKTKRYLLAELPVATLVIVAAVVSLALHLGGVLYASDRPVIAFDTNQTRNTNAEPIRVLTASDPYTSGLARDLIDTGPEPEPLDADTLASDALETTPELDPLSADIELEPRDIETPDPTALDPALDLAAAMIPDELLESPGDAPSELDLPLAGPLASAGDDEGIGDAAGMADGMLGSDGLGSSEGIPGGLGKSAGDGVLDQPSAAATADPGLDIPPIDDPPDFTPDLGAPLDIEDLAGIDLPLELDEDFTFTVQRFTTRDEPGYLRIEIQAEQSLNSKLRVLPKDMVFLIDASGSIEAETLEQVALGVGDAIAALNQSDAPGGGDRFNIVLFNDQVNFFHDESLLIEATPATVNQAVQFLRTARAQGFTAVDAAVRQLLIPEVKAGRVYDIVLITDGNPTRGVLQSDELINLVTADNDLVSSIYTIGVGRKINRTLLDYLAYRNRGFATFADRADEIRPALRGLSQTLRFPLITNISTEVAGIDPSQVYPRRLPDIHRGQTLDVFGRFNQPTPIVLTLSGQSSRGRVDLTMTRHLDDAGWAGSTIRTDWASRKLHSLYGEYLRQGKPRELLDELRRTARTYRLDTID